MTAPPRITVVLLSYQRPQNIPIILDALRRQTLPVQVFLWNNGPADVRSDLLDRYEQSEANVGCMARWRLAREASTPYVMSLDDDLCPAREDALETIVRELDDESDPRRAIGICGARFGWIPRYAWRRDIGCRRYSDSSLTTNALDGRRLRRDVRVDLVKGRLLAIRRQVLDDLELPEEREDDLFLCGALAGGARRFHRVPAALNDAFYDLPERGLGNRFDSQHIASRERARRRYLGGNSSLHRLLRVVRSASSRRSP